MRVVSSDCDVALGVALTALAEGVEDLRALLFVKYCQILDGLAVCGLLERRAEVGHLVIHV